MQKKSTKYLALFLLLMLSSSFSLHKFYVSHYSLTYRNQSIQITGKVFTDDLEKALQQQDPSVRIDEKQSPEILGKKIAEYYKSHLHLKNHKTVLETHYVGYELENDVTFIYLEVSNLSKAPNKLAIHCDALKEVFEDQVNIFRIECGTILETISLRGKESDIEVK